jgi:hypothetical protein
MAVLLLNNLVVCVQQRSPRNGFIGAGRLASPDYKMDLATFQAKVNAAADHVHC